MKPDFGETSNNSRKGGETNGNLSWNHDPFLGYNAGRGLRVLYTSTWEIQGTEDLKPYITAKDKGKKWLFGTVGMAVISAVLAQL